MWSHQVKKCLDARKFEFPGQNPSIVTFCFVVQGKNHEKELKQAILEDL